MTNSHPPTAQNREPENAAGQDRLLQSGDGPKARPIRGAKRIVCPTCGAGVGEPCRGSAYSGRSHRTVQSHTRRIEAARDAS